jgi:hypothetical protein
MSERKWFAKKTSTLKKDEVPPLPPPLKETDDVTVSTSGTMRINPEPAR